jgi:hypothetical protein
MLKNRSMGIPHGARVITVPERFRDFVVGSTKWYRRSKENWTTLVRDKPQHGSYSNSLWQATYLGKLTLVLL